MTTKQPAQLGQVIWWTLKNVRVSVTDLRRHLAACGLPEKYAREPRSRNAFIRAARAMEEDRIMRRVSESKETVVYQFTSEFLSKSKLQYAYEAQISLDKKSGLISTDNPKIKAKLQELYAISCNMLRTKDIRNIVKRVFKNEAEDLLPLRRNGAVYFVPRKWEAVVDKVQAFLAKVGVPLETLVVPNQTEARGTVHRAFEAEALTVLDDLEAEVKEMIKEGGEKRSLKVRMGRVKKLKDRGTIYHEMTRLLSKQMDGRLFRLEKQLKKALAST